jgi:hypothetical protein
MSFWEIVKTCFGYYRNWEERNDFVLSNQIISNEDIRETETPIQIVQPIDKKNIFGYIYGHEPLKIIFKNAIES